MGSTVGTLKPDLYVVTHRNPGALERGPAHANAEPASRDEHGAASEGHAVE